MESKLGQNIKSLRTRKNMTQGQLAELVGVSYQAVSKWESDTTLPDVSLVPRIAQIFQVTTDELFSYSIEEQEKDIESIRMQAQHLRESNPAKARDILNEGLKKYPDNDILLCNLLYVCPHEENIPIAKKVIQITKSNELKYDALRFLAYAYSDKGETDLAIEALEQIPEIYFTKLSEMAFVVTGKAKFDAADKQKWISINTLIQMMAKIAEYYTEIGKKNAAIKEYEKALSLIHLFCDEQSDEEFKDFAIIGEIESYIEYFDKQIDKLL